MRCNKTKYRFAVDGQRFEIDVYPSAKSAPSCAPSSLRERTRRRGSRKSEILREVTGEAAYKNSSLAREQKL